MGLKWRNGRLYEDPPHHDFSRRELIVVSLFLPFLSGLLTAMIPDCIRYPKAIWADWIVLIILIAFVMSCWAYTIWFWVYACRRYRELE